MSAGEISERKLIGGWAAVPGVRVRQAGAADMGAVGDLAALAGVDVEEDLAAAVTAGTAGAALRAGLREGQEGFARYMARQFIANRDEPMHAYLSGALVLAAEHREHGVIGALIAYPPPNIAAMHLQGTRRTITGPRERDKLVMAGPGVSGRKHRSLHINAFSITFGDRWPAAETY
jgi:hypothetical protein